MAKSLLPDAWEVPQVFRDRLGNTVGRQRSIVADGHLLLILHEPPGWGEVDRDGRFFWRNAQGEWRSDDFGDGPEALRKHIAEYQARLAKLDELEADSTTVRDYFKVLRQISPLLRAARNLHRTLQEARTKLSGSRELIDFRDQAYSIERNAEFLHNDSKSALEFEVGRQGEEQARSARQLNLLAAFFFPIVTLTAVFGVNLEHGLENAVPPLPFLIVMVVGLGAGSVLTWMITRKTPFRS